MQKKTGIRSGLKLAFPACRPRRLRGSEALRRLVAETRLSADSLIMPYFVRDGRGVREPIQTMPGQYRFSPDQLLKEVDTLKKAGVRSLILFGIPETRDTKASSAMAHGGIIQKTLRLLRKHHPEMLIVTDLCLCAYMSHGHCGVIHSRPSEIDNDKTCALLAKTALSHAEAGAGMIAPSDMMDGRVRAIRSALDQKGFSQLPIMSYSAKYASAFYGPFRDAAHSAPKPGVGKGGIPKDRKSYQMDFANAREAVKEMALDLEEGADILMVKPALAYLDIIRMARETFPVPIAAYSVSGEYSMVKAAAAKGYGDEKALVLEMVTGIFRAGASILLTYHAKEIARWIKNA